jgi:hypothetical protein
LAPSYVSPAVVDQYREWRTIDDFDLAIFASSARARWFGTGRASAAQLASLVENPTSAGGGLVSPSLSCSRFRLEGGYVARKTVLVSDMSGVEIPDGKGATIRITFRDARKGVRELDVTDEEAEKLGGRSVARRGRRPKTTT